MNSLVAVNWSVEMMSRTGIECTFAINLTGLLEFLVRVICRNGPRYYIQVFLICGDFWALIIIRLDRHDSRIQNRHDGLKILRELITAIRRT